MTPVVSIRNLSKTFGETKVLSDLNLDFFPGQVHALVGQNGSGKSTFIKILSGYHSPDAGASLCIQGENVDFPLDGEKAFASGLRFVHQDLGLIDSMTILENLAAGRFTAHSMGLIDWKAERRRARADLAKFDLDLDPDRKVSGLTAIERAIVGIARTFRFGNIGLLVLDEPTAYLPQSDVLRLFQTLRNATSQGTSVILVTHRLSEVFAISDVVSILRDGRLQGTHSTLEIDSERLVSEILGEQSENLRSTGTNSPTSDSILDIKNLSGRTVDKVSFGLRAGEILGVTGLGGMGEEEIPYLIYGSASRNGGSVTLAGSGHTIDTPQEALAMGVVLVPANRLRDSTIPNASVAENVTLPVLRDYCRGSWLKHHDETLGATKLLKRFRVHPPIGSLRMSQLSGGNQQKAILGKWLQTKPRVLLLHEPTNGVDIGSRAHLYSLIRHAAAQGCAILISSVEHEELADLCDRVLILNRGSVVDELVHDEVTKERVIASCYLGDFNGLKRDIAR